MLGSAVCVTLVAVASAGAAPQQVAACPSPKPLPVSLKRPPAGASATQFANFLLALPQREPCDVSRFTSTFFDGQPGLYPEGRPMQAVARAAAPTEAQVRPRLAVFLQGSTSRAAALQLFDRADVKAKVTDPTLRAALVSLHGTVAEPLIAFFLRAASAELPRFGGLPVTVLGRASVVGAEPRKIQIIINVRFQGDHFALLSAVFAHEILHHDVATNNAEEVLLNALTAIVYMQLVNRRPELSALDTELSRNMNDYALEWTNSRTPGASRSAIIAPAGKDVAPGSRKSTPDFWTIISNQYVGQIRGGTAEVVAAPPVYATVLRKLLAPGASIAKARVYSRATAQLLSRLNDTWLTPADRLRVSVLLGLVSIEEIVKYTGLTRPEAVAQFRLAPILAAMK
jgi:hypothetical protein